MTISTTTSQVSQSGNAVTTDFTVPFYFLLDSDLLVTQKVGATTTVLALNYDYTVSGAGVLTGGTVRLTTAAPDASTVTITRTVPVTQLTDYVQDDAFPAESHEKALDKLTMICQQLSTQISNAVLASTTEGEANTASNLGGGFNVYKQKNTLDLQFRSLSGQNNGTKGFSYYQDRIEIDVEYLLGTANYWYGGQQSAEYTLGTTGGLGDHVGFSGIVHNNTSVSVKDNIIGLRGHAYHDGAFNNDAGAVWGIVTEAWSNPGGWSTLIGAEFATISTCPFNTVPIIGMNVVFKNRMDTATHPTASLGSGVQYNRYSSAVFISSQARPSGAGAAWGGVGSGWNSAIRIGDVGFGSGLDWEGGDTRIIGTTKGYSTILDMVNIFNPHQPVGKMANKDLAGGYPWLFLWKSGTTYFGMRFCAQVSTGEIENAVVAIAGSGYNVDDEGQIINIYGGVAATYKVKTLVGGAGTGVATIEILTPGTLFHTRPASVPYTTVHTSGTGNDFLAIEVKQVVGERIEYWRMADPGNMILSGTDQNCWRYGFVDMSWTEYAQDGSFIRNHD